jgi:hypothetical protein
MIARSCSGSVIVSQETTESLPAFELARSLSHFGAWHHNPIVQPLVIAFLVVMLEELENRTLGVQIGFIRLKRTPKRIEA